MPLTPLVPVLALALVATSPPAAAPTPEVRARVRALLGSMHGPVPPEHFRAIGPGAEEALADFARANDFPSRRIRALEALAGLGGARAEAVHREVAGDRGAPSPVRRGAIRGLGRVLAPGEAPGALGPFLEQDRDPGVRAAAAEALAERAPATGCARVQARARREPDPSRFGRALRTCERAGSASSPGR
ncbi:MAG TPA: HEAT repeat domain-containing protein [Anaeromyxobacter sp.]